MYNANNDPAARIPRNAIRAWQSNATIAKLSGEELTTSLRVNGIDGRHPKDWPHGHDRYALQMLFQSFD